MDTQHFFTNLTTFITKPSLIQTFVDILLSTVPIWTAVMIGVLIGWFWTPRWTGVLLLGFRSKLRGFVWTAPPGFGARRLWIAFTAFSAFSVGRRMWFKLRQKEPYGDGRSSVDVNVNVK